MKITCFKYADSVFGENYIFKGGSKDRLLPITFCFYLIEYADKKILVDTGCNECVGFAFENFIEPATLLENYGLSFQDITDVIITHGHHDHIALISRYKNATIHIQKDEYPSTKDFIPDEFSINLFDEEYLLYDKLLIKKIGGHTKGSCIVVANNYVLCGDECYYGKSLTHNIVIGSIFDEENNKLFLEEYSSEKYIPLFFHAPNLKTMTLV